jgi:hypothetical protein
VTVRAPRVSNYWNTLRVQFGFRLLLLTNLSVVFISAASEHHFLVLFVTERTAEFHMSWNQQKKREKERGTLFWHVE